MVLPACGVMSHGHRHPRLDAAITNQLAKVAHTTNLGLSKSHNGASCPATRRFYAHRPRKSLLLQ